MNEPIERFDVPTVDAILQIPGVTRETAERVVAVLAGTLAAREASPKTDAWARRCYHLPEDDGHEIKLRACDELLGTCGVESLTTEEADSYTDEGIRFCPPFSYCNAGDSYVATLLRDHEHGKWLIACWADAWEEYEREHKLGDFEEFTEAPDCCPCCHGSTLKLESFKRGAREGTTFVESGIGYAFVCADCNHHCQTPEDWAPPEDDEPEDDEPEEHAP